METSPSSGILKPIIRGVLVGGVAFGLGLGLLRQGDSGPLWARFILGSVIAAPFFWVRWWQNRSKR